MPMMDIRPVPVNMRYRSMGMDMIVRFLDSKPFVIMLMMFIVVMGMMVRYRFMGMQMAVLFPAKDEYPAKHQCRGKPVLRRRAFAEHDDREQCADEWPYGKECGSSG